MIKEYSALYFSLGTALSFLLGSFFSLAAGFIGMKSATHANSRTATAAKDSGIIKALDVAFKGGSVMGMSVVGDLFESLLKRLAGQKDSSQLLPGHGGVLDRLDALLPTLPIAAVLLQLLR